MQSSAVPPDKSLKKRLPASALRAERFLNEMPVRSLAELSCDGKILHPREHRFGGTLVQWSKNNEEDDMFQWIGIAALGLIIVGCGDEAKETANAATTTEYDSKYKAIISTNCASSGCHGGTQSPNLSTLTGVKNNRTAALARINDGTMPPNPSSQWTSTDKALLKTYLETSSEVK